MEMPRGRKELERETLCGWNAGNQESGPVGSQEQATCGFVAPVQDLTFTLGGGVLQRSFWLLWGK